MNRPHALYRFRDSAGQLLYIGITHDPGERWPAHMRDKPWWAEVATIDLEPYPDRASVLAAERAAIRAEHPLHNVMHNRSAGGQESAPRGRTDRDPRPPMLPVDSVVALAMTNRKDVPVGQVREADHQSATLALYSWLTEWFSAGELVVQYKHIRCLRFAAEMSSAQKIAAGYAPSQLVYDMDPLADFQNEWKQPFRQLTAAEIRHIETVMATPGHYGRVL